MYQIFLETTNTYTKQTQNLHTALKSIRGLPAAEMELLVNFYTLENYETTTIFRCLEDSCPATSYTKKDSLKKPNNRKHKITKFNCLEETNGKQCPFSSKSYWLSQNTEIDFTAKTLPSTTMCQSKSKQEMLIILN